MTPRSLTHDRDWRSYSSRSALRKISNPSRDLGLITCERKPSKALTWDRVRWGAGTIARQRSGTLVDAVKTGLRWLWTTGAEDQVWPTLPLIDGRVRIRVTKPFLVLVPLRSDTTGKSADELIRKGLSRSCVQSPDALCIKTSVVPDVQGHSVGVMWLDQYRDWRMTVRIGEGTTRGCVIRPVQEFDILYGYAAVQ